MESVQVLLDRLKALTGESEEEILGRALKEGLRALLRKAAMEAFFEGRLSREQAEALVGREEVERWEYAAESVRKDARWALEGESG